jgi:hypothetical protein
MGIKFPPADIRTNFDTEDAMKFKCPGITKLNYIHSGSAEKW